MNGQEGKVDYKRTSKFMSYILRHKPDVIGIELDRYGWADVEELIRGIAKTRMFNRDILEEIVRTDEKQRYAFNEDKTRIRASQGHSIPVDLQLEAIEPPEILWHGTAKRFEASIDQTGLNRGVRMYVHLSSDRQMARRVGERHGKAIVYRVKSGKMYRDGFRFYRSANGVWMTLMVPAAYLEKETEPLKDGE